MLMTAGAAAADVLIVRSTGPSAKSFPPGKRLAETARITLKASDAIVVLDRGGTRSLRGPGTFTVGAPAGIRTASAAPVQQRRARIGAVRGVGSGETRAPTIWHVDVAKSSNICIAPPSDVILWRADATKAMALNVTRAGDGSTRQLSWPAGTSTLGWPADLPIADGQEFRLSWSGAAAPTLLRFRTLARRPNGPDELASTLMGNQCEAQLDLFIETMKEPDAVLPRG